MNNNDTKMKRDIIFKIYNNKHMGMDMQLGNVVEPPTPAYKQTIIFANILKSPSWYHKMHVIIFILAKYYNFQIAYDHIHIIGEATQFMY